MAGMHSFWRASAIAFGTLAAVSLAGAGVALAIWVVDQTPSTGQSIAPGFAIALGVLGIGSVFAHRTAKANAARWPHEDGVTNGNS